MPFGIKNITTGIENFNKQLKDTARGKEGTSESTKKSLLDKYNEYSKSVESAVSEVENFAVAVGESVDAIVAGATTGVFNSEVFPKDYARELCFRMDFFAYDRKHRFKKAKSHPRASVILPLPRNISTQTSIGYSTSELGTFGVLENTLQNIDGGAVARQDGFINSIGAAAVEAARAGVSGGENLGFRALNALSGGGVGAVAGFIPNPHLATLFTGMEMRKFTFSIQCTSTNEADSAALQKIIRTLKQHSLPRLASTRTQLQYPHEVFISFSEGGYRRNGAMTPLDKMFNFKRCVLDGITINVGSQGTPTFFNNLEPTELTIDLSFTETEIETANDYGAESFNTSGENVANDIVDGAREYAKSIEIGDN